MLATATFFNDVAVMYAAKLRVQGQQGLKHATPAATVLPMSIAAHLPVGAY